MPTRRSLLASLAGIGFARSICAQTPAWRAGLQLYTVRDGLAADIDGTLKHVADLGYREVELAGLPATSAAAFNASLRRSGLGVPSMHASYESLLGDLDVVLKEATSFGASFVA